MTWATSADPWPNRVCAGGATAAPSPPVGQLAERALKVPFSLHWAAAAHLGLLALLLPLMVDTPIAAAILASGFILTAAALRSPQASGHPPEIARLFTTEPSTSSQPDTRAAEALFPHVPSQPSVSNADWAGLMARMSHELRTPLNAVLGFSDVMAKEMFGPLGHARYEEYVRHIHDSGCELLKSAEDTLAVTSLLTSPAHVRPADIVGLAATVRDAWAFLVNRATARGVGVAIAIDDGIEVVTERRALRQVVINLLSEALLRTPSGATITVRATARIWGVEFSIATDRSEASRTRDPGSLHVCLAVALLGQIGADLVETADTDGTWSVTTRLDEHRQPDFFAVVAR